MFKEKNLRLNVFEYGIDNWKPRQWFHNIRQFFRNIRFAWQRATKGYCDWDTWDLDTFYTNLLIDSLQKFRKEANGHPMYLQSIEAWHEILDEIILLLKQYAEEAPIEEENEYETAYYEYLKKSNLSDLVTQRSEEEKTLSVNYYKREAELSEIRDAKRKRAFELISLHFNNLWW